MPLAAFLVAACLIACMLYKKARGYVIWLLAGLLLGAVLHVNTHARQMELARRYVGRQVRVVASVDAVDTVNGYHTGAQLRTQLVDGQEVSFLFQCDGLPWCDVGQCIEGVFLLEMPAASEQVEQYADGVTFAAEYLRAFAVRGEDNSLRANAHRLQQMLSASICRLTDEDAGGVLAAMVVGDRTKISSELRAAYRAAGLSHVLVVSGMHVTILCGGAFQFASLRRRLSLRRRRIRAVVNALLALLLVCITGFTPSVLRAGTAVWIGALGSWILAPTDALTSLALAGLWMTAVNSYAVCDIGFELSFAAVLGTLAGAELARRGLAILADKDKPTNRIAPYSRLRQAIRKVGTRAFESLCISLCASAATFPILVLRGMSASLYSLVSSIAVLWLVPYILLLGIATALTGLFAPLLPAYRIFSFGAGLLTGWFNSWAQMAQQWPGAQIYFNTGYAAAVCLLLIGLCLLAAVWKIRLRIVLPTVAILITLAIIAGNTFERDVVKVSIAGSGRTPSVVAVQNGKAVVLYRGGSSREGAVERALAKSSAEQIALLIDLRQDSAVPCSFAATRTIRVSELGRGWTKTGHCGDIDVELYNTGYGCAVRLTVDGHQLVTVSGSFALADTVHTEYLLASPSDPSSFTWDTMLAVGGEYSWMTANGNTTDAGNSISIRPGGGVRVR